MPLVMYALQYWDRDFSSLAAGVPGIHLINTGRLSFGAHVDSHSQ